MPAAVFAQQAAADAAASLPAELPLKPGPVRPMEILSTGTAPVADTMSAIMERARAAGATSSRLPPQPRPAPNPHKGLLEKLQRKNAPWDVPAFVLEAKEANFAAPQFMGRIGDSSSPFPSAKLEKTARGTRSAVSGTTAPAASAPQAPGTGFSGPTFNGVGGWVPPDTQGAVGPNHVMFAVNGAVGIYSKATGAQLAFVSLSQFFTIPGSPYPRGGAFDPRVLYDKRSGRWFATGMEFGNPSGQANGVVLAVSRTSDPTGTWDKYFLNIGNATTQTHTHFTDYSSLGVDDNGVYIGATIFADGLNGNQGASWVKIVATPKAPLVAAAPSLGTVYQADNITSLYSTPQPAANLDGSGGGRAWFVCSDGFWYGSNGVFSPWTIRYSALTWTNGVPSLSSDFGTLFTARFYGSLPSAQAQGSTTPIEAGDYRIQMAMIRNGRLWTCRNVGLDATGGFTPGGNSSRVGCEWMELDIATATPTLAQMGRVYDPAATSPRFYYYPSVTVSGQGHAALGFSGSRGTEFIGIYTAGRLRSDTAGTLQGILQVKAGAGSYTIDPGGRNRWGDYSYTAVDPSDDQTIWTFQEYTQSFNNWGTWAQALRAPAPTLTAPGGGAALVTADQGQSNVTSVVTGTGFFDPGATFPKRLAAQISGIGITNVAVTYTSPTQATVTFNVSDTAPAGRRDLILTNPDGQSATLTDAIQIQDKVSLDRQVTGTVVLQGLTTGASTRSVTFEFRPVGGGQPIVFSKQIGAATTQRAFSFLLPRGQYNLAVKGAIYLRTVVAVNTDTNLDEITVPAITLLAGDINNDNKVNLTDLVQLRGNYNKTGASLTGDISGDSKVNLTDLVLLRANYGKNGQP